MFRWYCLPDDDSGCANVVYVSYGGRIFQTFDAIISRKSYNYRMILLLLLPGYIYPPPTCCRNDWATIIRFASRLLLLGDHYYPHLPRKKNPLIVHPSWLSSPYILPGGGCCYWPAYVCLSVPDVKWRLQLT